MKQGLVDDQGRTVAFCSIPTESEKRPDDAIRRMRLAADAMLAEAGLSLADVNAIGLGTPGTMDIPSGMILEPPNLPAWRDFPIRDRVSQAFDDRPVAFANDGGAAAFGESWIGSGRDFHSLVMLTLGTGVGGGIIIGDMSMDGANSHGSECGHMIINPNPDARVCGCGQTGHLEAYASATALIKRTREALAQNEASLLHELSDGQEISGLLVAEAAEQGDALARQIVMDTADYIATGVATLVFIVDPGAVIIGGAMTFGGASSALGREFLHRIDEHVRRKVFPAQAKNLTIRFASLGSNAGYIGAAGIARVAYHKSPCQ